MLAICFVLLAIASSLPATASALRVPNFFASHMVLQRGHAAVWGWTDADAKIELTVLVGNKTLAHASTHAASNGAWNISVSLTAQKTTAVKIVSLSDDADGQEDIVLDNVAFGDVFLCSG
jgi:hypothetical protein